MPRTVFNCNRVATSEEQVESSQIEERLATKLIRIQGGGFYFLAAEQRIEWSGWSSLTTHVLYPHARTRLLGKLSPAPPGWPLSVAGLITHLLCVCVRLLRNSCPAPG
jgi:hypothetical protein